MSTSRKKSIARDGLAEELGAKRNHTAFTLMPSKIIARHEANRSTYYSLAAELPELKDHPAFEGSDVFCFTRAEVMARVASFERIGQETRVKVTATATRMARLRSGFLRHAAALYLEVQGKLDACPGMRDGLAVDASAQAKTPEDQIAERWANKGENEHLPLTPIDEAWEIRRLLALQVPRSEIALGMDMDERNVSRRLALLGLPVETQIAVREGRMSMTAALADGSQKGLGNAAGKRANMSVKKMRDAVERQADRPAPSVALEPAQLVQLTAMIAGETFDADQVPEAVAEWAAWMQPEKQPKPPKTSKPKKKLPTNGRKDN